MEVLASHKDQNVFWIYLRFMVVYIPNNAACFGPAPLLGTLGTQV